MSKQFNHLNIPSHWQSYWTRFPEGHTILEALIQWVSQVDEMVDNQNKLSDTVTTYGSRLDQFIDQFEGNLSDEVKDTLGEWQDSGFLDVVISEALQWQLDDYITTNEQDKDDLTAQLAQTDSDISSRGVNILNYKHLVPNIDVLVDFVEGDWSQALQTAMDDLPDKGGTIFIPTNIGVENTVIYPTVSNSTTELKPITLKGVSESTVSGVFGNYHGGLSAIEFRGEGSLFDLRLGEEANTNGAVAFIDLAFHGNNIPDTIGINAYDLKGARFDNVIVRRFGSGLLAHDLYYSTFENFRALYNIDYGAYITGYINGTKFHRCTFSKTTTGTGFYSSYSGVVVNFDGCWFEGNERGLHITNTEQISFNDCYFELNQTTFYVSEHEESGATQVSFNDCNLTIASEVEYGLRPNGDVNIIMANNRINWLAPIEKAFIQPVITGAREGTTTLIAINNEWRTNKPTDLITRNRGSVLVNIDRHESVIDQELLLKQLLELESNIHFKNGNTGLSWNSGDIQTVASLAEFPEITTANGIARMFRTTNTEGDLEFNIHRGDGSSASAHRFNAKTGDLYMRGALGVGNSEDGQVDTTTPTKKVEIFNPFGNSLGFIQLYEG